MANENNLDNNWGDDNAHQEPINTEIGADFVDLEQPSDGQIPLIGSSLKEKLVISALLIVGVGTLVFGYWTLVNNFSNPSALADLGQNTNNSVTDQSIIPASNSQLTQQVANILELQRKDTDVDGLSDYDELYIRQTSPYLADTDGDSYNDKQELDAGHDPNCPGRDDCFKGGNTAPPASGATVPSLVTNVTGTGSLDQIMKGQATPAQVRAALLNGGMTQADLDSISDDDLMVLYQQIISGQGVDSTTGTGTISQVVNQPLPATSTPITGIDNIKSIDDLKALSGAQVRALMIQQGAAEATLKGISDDDLKSMFLSQLEAQLTNYPSNTNSSQ